MADARDARTLEEAVRAAARAGSPVIPDRDGRNAVALAGAPSGRVGPWLVVGSPVRDPWGVPGPEHRSDASRRADCTSLARDFSRYGPAAVQLATGPFVAVDTAEGTAVRSLSGLMPMYVSTAGSWLASTSATVMAMMDAAPAKLVPPGASAGPDGSLSRWGPIAADPGGCRLPWAWAERTIDDRVARLGPARNQRPDPEQEAWFTDSHDAIYLPRLKSLRKRRDSLARYHRLRDDLSKRWWLSRLAGHWLYAPAFERPVLDTLAMLRPVAGLP